MGKCRTQKSHRKRATRANKTSSKYYLVTREMQRKRRKMMLEMRLERNIFIIFKGLKQLETNSAKRRRRVTRRPPKSSVLSAKS
jgi:hypothetical protein